MKRRSLFLFAAWAMSLATLADTVPQPNALRLTFNDGTATYEHYLMPSSLSYSSDGATIYLFANDEVISYPTSTLKQMVFVHLADTERLKVHLSDKIDNTDKLALYMNEAVDVTLDGRTLRGGMWNMLTLPFDATIEGATMAGYKYASGDAVHGVSLEFDEVLSMSAGVPYLVSPKADIVEPTFENVVITVTDGSIVAATDDVAFVGIIHPIENFGIDEPCIYLGEDNNLHYAIPGITSHFLAGMRAYFKVNNEALAAAQFPAHIVLHPLTPTDISMPAVENHSAAAGAEKMLRNGHVYILRDGKMYDLQGCTVNR